MVVKGKKTRSSPRGNKRDNGPALTVLEHVTLYEESIKRRELKAVNRNSLVTNIQEMCILLLSISLTIKSVAAAAAAAEPVAVWPRLTSSIDDNTSFRLLAAAPHSMPYTVQYTIPSMINGLNQAKYRNVFGFSLSLSR